MDATQALRFAPALLFLISLRGVRSVYWIYAVMVLLGIVRSFNGPATRAIVPQMVPEEHLPNAVAWGSTTFQSATILGPSIGGVIYAIANGPLAVYATSMTLSAAAMLSMLGVNPISKPRPREPVTVKTILAGLHYIWRKKIILGSNLARSLCRSARRSCGAASGVCARNPAHRSVGARLLRCAPGIGAARWRSFSPIGRSAKKHGCTMFLCVAGFGVFTILFGISRNLYLSLAALILVGATDMVSVIIRGVLIQIATPDEMRGRVNAVDMVFIGASNELGGVRIGLDGDMVWDRAGCYAGRSWRRSS